jgi:hypothetical protein
MAKARRLRPGTGAGTYQNVWDGHGQSNLHMDLIPDKDQFGAFRIRMTETKKALLFGLIPERKRTFESEPLMPWHPFVKDMLPEHDSF